MSHSSEEQTVVKHTLECDQCGKVEEFDVPVGDNLLLTDIGWLEFTHPHATSAAQQVTFHTQRCAVGFFRAIVKEAAGEDDPEPEADAEDDPKLVKDALRHAGVSVDEG
jgi:hypothetical protein